MVKAKSDKLVKMKAEQSETRIYLSHYELHEFEVPVQLGGEVPILHLEGPAVRASAQIGPINFPRPGA